MARAIVKTTVCLQAYRALWRGMALGVRLHIRRRIARHKEDPHRWRERMGYAPKPRPQGTLIWIHGASIGETISALALAHTLQQHTPQHQAPQHQMHILFTSCTLSAIQRLSPLLPPNTSHLFMPYDHPGWVRRFLQHHRPNLAVWIESELWPNAILQTHDHNIPIALVNARMSSKSLRRWHRIPTTFRHLIACFSLICAQNPAQAQALNPHALREVLCPGNLKWAVPTPPVDHKLLDTLQRLCQHRTLWLALNTHEDDEARVLRLHQALRADFPNLLTIILPRHPHARGTAIAALCQDRSIPALRRSAGALPADDSEVYIADSLGEVGTFASLCPVVLMGGTFGQHGGHAPCEPAALGCAQIFGPDTANAQDLCATLSQEDAALQGQNEHDCLRHLRTLLGNPEQARALGRKAQTIKSQQERVAQSIARRLLALLP